MTDEEHFSQQELDWDLEVDLPGQDEAGPTPPAQEPRRRRGPHQAYLVLSRRATTILGAGLGVILVWTFVLGILVGQGFLFENQTFFGLEKHLGRPEVQGEKPVVELAEEGPSSKPQEPASPPELTFYKSLAQSKAQTRGQVRRPVPAPAAGLGPAEAPASPGPAAALEPGEAPPQEPRDRPEPAVKTVPREQSAAPPPRRRAGDNYAVQVAAVTDIEHAREVVAGLRGQGHPAYFYEVVHAGRRYFRIRVGRYRTREEARAALARLKREGRADMFIAELTD